MRIKKRLQLNIAISVIIATAIIIVLLLTLGYINRAVKELDIAGEIAASAFEINLFRENYLRSGNERAKIQWFAKQELISGLLQEAGETFQHTFPTTRPTFRLF